MRIKVGDQVFDGNKELVAIYFTPEEKELVSNMAEDSRVLCQSPGDMPHKARADFIKDLRRIVEGEDSDED